MKQFVKKRKAEYFYRRAKEEKYRARSAYKLLEINERFKIIKKGDIVVDLGAAPGSWSQVALNLVGETGYVIAVDMLTVPPISGPFKFVRADLAKPSAKNKILNALPNQANVVISDVAPEFSGIKSKDIGLAMELNKKILEIAKEILKPRGHFCCKSFQGKEFQEFISEVKRNFQMVKTFKPKSSLKTSPEIYLIGKVFKQ